MHRPRPPLALIPLAALAALTACTTPGTTRTPAPLENTTWRLVELSGSPAVRGEAERAAGLEFLADGGRVTGSTGCNRLTGTFARTGETLRFGPAATTRMACVDPRLMSQEQAFLAALTATERHSVDGDTLVLIGPAGPVARLVRASAR